MLPLINTSLIFLFLMSILINFYCQFWFLSDNTFQENSGKRMFTQLLKQLGSPEHACKNVHNIVFMQSLSFLQCIVKAERLELTVAILIPNPSGTQKSKRFRQMHLSYSHLKHCYISEAHRGHSPKGRCMQTHRCCTFACMYISTHKF